MPVLTAPDAFYRLIDVLGAEPDGRRGYWRFRCPLPGHKNGDQHPSGELWCNDGRMLIGCWTHTFGQGDLTAKDAARAILSHYGLTWRELLKDRPRDAWGARMATDTPRPRAVAWYDFRDESGRLLYQEVRFEPGWNGRKKDFRPRRPKAPGVEPGRFDRDAWEYGMGKAGEVRRVLYRLPGVLAALAADSARWVLIPGGAGKCDLLWELGFCSTCNVCGEGSWWLDDYSKALAGANVAVLPDNDAPGWRHAGDVMFSMRRHGCCVKLLEMPGVKDGGDVKDWVLGLASTGMALEAVAGVLAGMLLTAPVV